MTDNRIELSRRKILAGLGTIGVAGAGAGLGTSAFFSDQETFTNNQLVAGELDMKVKATSHYSDWMDGEEQYASMSDSPNLVLPSLDVENGRPIELEITNPQGFADVTERQIINDGVGDLDESIGDGALCGTGADTDGEFLVQIGDVKPGDFGIFRICFQLCDNPGYVWFDSQLVSCAENGTTEPEAEDPDESSLWPLLAAGAVPSASSLFDSDTREKVTETAKKAVESDSVTREDVLKTAGAGAAGIAGAGAMAGTAAAAVGDRLGKMDLPDHVSGVGIAFDGNYVYVSGSGGFSSTELQIYEPPADGDSPMTKVAVKDIVDSDGNPVSLENYSWDKDRGQLWAADGGGSWPVYLLDVGDPTDGSQDAVATHKFDATDISGFSTLDGLAYGAGDDSLWLSPDVNDTIWHYSSDGTQLGTITPVDGEGNELGISGVAVGADLNNRPTLYIGIHNPSERILRVYADDGEFIEEFSTADEENRIEGLACDPNTYAPKEAILAKYTNTPEVDAFEVEPGTCLVGGEPEPEPEPEPDECADVELLDAVQIGVARGTLAEQFEDDDDDDGVFDADDLFTAMSLREFLGGPVLLEGDIDAEDGGGTGDERCFSATDTNCLTVVWWLPIDHGNEVQTDSVTFDLGFYTEQCRHNDGSGQFGNNENPAFGNLE